MTATFLISFTDSSSPVDSFPTARFYQLFAKHTPSPDSGQSWEAVAFRNVFRKSTMVASRDAVFPGHPGIKLSMSACQEARVRRWRRRDELGSPEARAQLAHALLMSLDDLSESEIENLWLEEAIWRDEEIDAGKVALRPPDEVFTAARARLK
jgi:hypothetical protein